MHSGIRADHELVCPEVISGTRVTRTYSLLKNP